MPPLGSCGPVLLFEHIYPLDFLVVVLANAPSLEGLIREQSLIGQTVEQLRWTATLNSFWGILSMTYWRATPWGPLRNSRYTPGAFRIGVFHGAVLASRHDGERAANTGFQGPL